jgi:hypothetical protein
VAHTRAPYFIGEHAKRKDIGCRKLVELGGRQQRPRPRALGYR